MKARLLLLAVLATTALLPARISAQDEPPSVLKSVGVTAAEVGTGLVVSVAGVYTYGLYTGYSQFAIMGLTPAAAAAGVYGIGAWLEPGGSFGLTVLAGYIGAAAGLTLVDAFYSLYPTVPGHGLLSLASFPIGCAIGSVLSYKGSRKPREEEPTSWQLVPPSMGLALKRPVSGRPMEIAGVRLNLVGARF